MTSEADRKLLPEPSQSIPRKLPAGPPFCYRREAIPMRAPLQDHTRIEQTVPNLDRSATGRPPRQHAACARVAAFLAVAALWAGCNDPAPTQTPAPDSSLTAADASAADGAVTTVASATSATPGPADPSAPLATAAPPTTSDSSPSASAQPATTSTGATTAPTATPSATTTPTTTATTTPTPEPKLTTPATGSADELAQRLDDIYKPLETFRANFKQNYRAKVANVTKESSGVLLVERPNKLSFRYDPPNKNRVVSDGATLLVYEADNQQMVKQPVANTEYPGALAFIMGKGLRHSFTFTFHQKAKFPGGVVIVGKPRVANPAYQTILFYVDSKLLTKGDPAAIRRVLVLDVQGNRNRFDFTSVTRPASIDPGEFRFQPPPGTTQLNR